MCRITVWDASQRSDFWVEITQNLHTKTRMERIYKGWYLKDDGPDLLKEKSSQLG